MSVQPTGSVAPSLTQLPLELLACILAEIETAQAIRNLSVTCKALHACIESDGYRIFVRSRFPSIPLLPRSAPLADEGVQVHIETANYWKDAARGLTTLSRNLSRKAFVAQGIRHPKSKRAGGVVETFRRNRPHGPRMGFVPVIDSYEVRYGSEWTARREVVAWSEGASVVIRSRDLGSRRERIKHKRRTNEPHGPRWQYYIKEGVREGVDDITTLNLLLRSFDDIEEILVGRASGGLERVRMGQGRRNRALATYDTNGMPVRCTAVQPRDKRVAVACLGDLAVAIYSLNAEGENISSSLHTIVPQESGNSRTWSAKFLREGRVAVGLGRSKQPIHIYDLEQYSNTFERAIDIPFDGSAKLIGLEGPGSPSHGSSIYSIAPLPPSSASSAAEGDIFLSGAFDGHVRLHDLRLANSVVSLYSDRIDASSAIYSLLPIGQERFCAGGAKHSLIKVFDLRMPGQRVYHAADALRCSPQRIKSLRLRIDARPEVRCSISRHCPFHESIRPQRNWNVFLSIRSYGHEQSLESSVYSLSRPSSVSPTIFAGVQNWVTQLDLVSILDQHPDPVHEAESTSIISSQPAGPSPGWPIGMSRTAAEASEMDKATRKWDPEQKALNLTMYEQADPVELLHQRPIKITQRHFGDEEKLTGLDERWAGAHIH